MNGDTPKFNFEGERDSNIYSSGPNFYTLLMNYYQNKQKLSIEKKQKNNLSPKNNLNENEEMFSPVKKETRSISLPKGQFAMFLLKRFRLRNDYDKQHVDEFLLSKEQAFEFPSRDDDIID